MHDPALQLVAAAAHSPRTPPVIISRDSDSRGGLAKFLKCDRQVWLESGLCMILANLAWKLFNVGERGGRPPTFPGFTPIAII
ncbi:hypothetical protein BTUL_0117g00500 [Botrytis tulipae]|uniref:Uncharacterized protein n=1 Tax=Botrytis tulipae TaxID=87230 RepID=A0A4Z1EL64_9HELO|nr:hypothetical protein BTUL_0117g00500 [Botrytis tulipae]